MSISNTAAEYISEVSVVSYIRRDMHDQLHGANPKSLRVFRVSSRPRPHRILLLLL
jgi:hypothetical protein